MAVGQLDLTVKFTVTSQSSGLALHKILTACRAGDATVICCLTNTSVCTARDIHRSKVYTPGCDSQDDSDDICMASSNSTSWTQTSCPRPGILPGDSLARGLSRGASHYWGLATPTLRGIQHRVSRGTCLHAQYSCASSNKHKHKIFP